jgi:plasmid maintenance system antidote protein VapI
VQIDLKVAILESGQTQRAIAAKTGIPENRLSEIVRGWRPARDEEMHRLAAVLGRQVADLFRQPSAISA